MENILNKKLHIKPGLIIAIINPPAGFLAKLNPLPENVTILTKISSSCDFIQYFVTSIAGLEKALRVIKTAIKSGGNIWISYQKQSSKVKTDINRDTTLPILREYGFKAVSIISIDDNWSALRIKPFDSISVKKSEKGKDVNTDKYIDKEKRIISPPEDLQAELKKNKKAADLFNSLAFTHKKEYVQWILDSKKEETRSKRVKGTVEMLLKGAKNPSDKPAK